MGNPRLELGKRSSKPRRMPFPQFPNAFGRIRTDESPKTTGFEPVLFDHSSTNA